MYRFSKQYVPKFFLNIAIYFVILDKEEAVRNISLKQPFKLRSACGTPKYTNFTAGFRDCLDYIYYDEDCLEVSQVVPFPSDEELAVHTALPSIVFPSDHVSLVSDLKWL